MAQFVGDQAGDGVELLLGIFGLQIHFKMLGHALDLGEQPNNKVPELSELACANLGLSWRKLAPHFAEIEARYDGLKIALGL